MTEQLSNKRLEYFASGCGLGPLDKQLTHREFVGIARELLELRAENAHLRQRCTWLQERRAVLRKLVSSRWSKRREVRRLRAKLAAGPVMPEVPSERSLSAAAVVFLPRFGPRGVYWAIRDALLAEQNGAGDVE